MNGSDLVRKVMLMSVVAGLLLPVMTGCKRAPQEEAPALTPTVVEQPVIEEAPAPAPPAPAYGVQPAPEAAPAPEVQEPAVEAEPREEPAPPAAPGYGVPPAPTAPATGGYGR